MWGATVYATNHAGEQAISIHAPRVGSDGLSCGKFGKNQRFQSTLPVWGATRQRKVISTMYFYFNPRSPCGERLFTERDAALFQDNFNPRSPCGERRGGKTNEKCSYYFNPRSPCGERPGWSITPQHQKLFQSTLPVWGATSKSFGVGVVDSISIHAPRVGSDLRGQTPCMIISISIHAPRVGSDFSGLRPLF